MIFEKWFKTDKKCQIRSCGGYVQFSILDGDGCDDSNDLIVSIDGIDNIECKSNENQLFNSCQCKIYAPKCIGNGIDLTYSTTTKIPTNHKNTISIKY